MACLTQEGKGDEVPGEAIMHASGGLSRAERELASAAVSRVNGCVYCAPVRAQRFEQQARRIDMIVQLFTGPQGAGASASARERSILAHSLPAPICHE